MKKYRIKYIDPSGNLLDADQTIYEAGTELDALKQFAEARKNDLIIENVEILSEDPFILRIAGYVESDDHQMFEIRETDAEYIGEEI